MEQVPLQTSVGHLREDQGAVEGAGPVYDSESTNPSFDFTMAALFAVALGIRAVFVWKDRLWLDEVWSATFAVQSFVDVIIATLRFDPHPPLYYLQLWVWASVSHSTLWLFANSIFWSWLSIPSAYYVTWKLRSRRIALVTTIILTVMPAAVGLAHSLRMYPMLTFLAIWVWYYSHQCLVGPRRWRNGALLLILLLAVSYSHATGALIIGYSGVFGLWYGWQERLKFLQISYWLKVHMLAGVLAFPVLVNSFLRSTSHTIAPDIWDIMRTFADLAGGPVVSADPWMFIPTSVLVCLVILTSSLDRKLRPMVAGFLLAPFGFGAMISYAIAPIWLDRVFFFTIPFLAVTLAHGALVSGRLILGLTHWRAARAGLTSLAAVSVAILAGLSLVQFEAVPKPTNYKAAAAVITSQLQHGDVVYIPSNVTYWGIMWYAAGPDWGSPLAVQGSGALDCDDRWCAILQRLGPLWRQRLHLEPQTRVILHDGVPFYVGHEIPTEARSAQRVWVVHNSNQPTPLHIDDDKVSQEWKDGRGITVQLLTR